MVSGNNNSRGFMQQNIVLNHIISAKKQIINLVHICWYYDCYYIPRDCCSCTCDWCYIKKRYLNSARISYIESFLNVFIIFSGPRGTQQKNFQN